MKWEEINMEFMVRLPRTQKQHESIWTVVDSMTKSTHFIPVKSSYSAEDYARILIDDIGFAMVLHYETYWIGVHYSNLRFGGHYKKGWVQR